MASALKAAPGVQQDSGELALQWLGAERAAKLLIDETLRVLWANSTALKWFQARDCLSMVAGQLSLGRSDSALKALLKRMDVTGAGLCLPVQGSRAHMILCAKRVSKLTDDPIFGLTARRTDEIAPAEMVGVLEVFRLTPSEFGVLKLLVAGFPAQQVADEQGTSIETVRTHIRRLYAKMDVSSREELLSRLRPFLNEM